ncbi:MAG: sigma-70 family RNA polymerase sigma factor [Pseudomonadota bacterium]
MSKRNARATVEGWFDQYHDRLLWFLTHELNVEAEAADLAQEVFLRMLRLDDVSAINHPRAFLFRVASNVVSDWRDRNRRIAVEAPSTFDQLSSTSEPVDSLVASARASALDKALKGLPPSQSSALVLRVKHGLTYREVASHMGVSERMVKRYIVKGYARLRDELQNL